MNSLIVKSDKYYLVRYQMLKSVVSRKHTTKEGNVTNRLELHTNSVVVYLYQILHVHYDIFWNNQPNLKGLNKSIHQGYLKYLGRGLSKCSDKDRFTKNLGLTIAIDNIPELDNLTAYNINKVIFNTKL